MQTQEQERQALLTKMKKNDKVLTTAGIYGTVIAVGDNEDEIIVKIDDNVRVKMIKAAIARNLTNEEAPRRPKPPRRRQAKRQAGEHAPDVRQDGGADRTRERRSRRRAASAAHADRSPIQE